MMLIGTLDTETLGLSTNSVVWELSLLTVEVNQFYEIQDTPHLWEIRLDLFEQLRLGRVIEKQTIQFHHEKMGSLAWETISGKSDSLAPIIPVVDALTQLRDKCHKLDELWINNASYDYSVLMSLAEDFGVRQQKDLWPYHIAMCLRPLWRKLGLPKPSAKSAHRASADVQDNLKTLQAFGTFLRSLA